MTVRTLAVFMSLWLGFALVGGIVDGQLIRGFSNSGAHTEDAQSLQAALQPEISSAPSGGFLSGIVSAFTATVDLLTGWVNMLFLNFSFFTGSFAIVGWIVRGLIGVPMITMFLLQVFGR